MILFYDDGAVCSDLPGTQVMWDVYSVARFEVEVTSLSSLLSSEWYYDGWINRSSGTAVKCNNLP